jgi:hypothetical protein
MPRKKQTFDMKKEVRKLARERVGTVPSSKLIVPKAERRKPKHKKQLSSAEAEST